VDIALNVLGYKGIERLDDGSSKDDCGVGNGGVRFLCATRQRLVSRNLANLLDDGGLGICIGKY
jgi:hypothetical protein